MSSSSSSPSSSPAAFVTHLLASLSSHPPPVPASSTNIPDTDAHAHAHAHAHALVPASHHPPFGSGSLHPAHASAAQPSTTLTSPAQSNPLQNAPDAVRKQLLTLHVLFPNELLPALDLLDRGLVSRLVIVREGEGDGSVGRLPGREGGDDARIGAMAEGKEKGKGNEEEKDKDKETDPFLPESTAYLAQQHPESRVPPSAPTRRENTATNTFTSPSTATDGTETETETESETAFYLVTSAQPAPQRPRYSSSSVAATAAAPSSSATHPQPRKTYQVRLPAWTCTCPAFAFAAFPPALPVRHEELWEREVDARRFFSALGNEPDPSTREKREGSWIFGGVAVNADGAMPPVCKHLLACVLGERCVLFEGFVRVRRVAVEEAAGWGAGWGD